jgi:putative intracellular protease/amidase
MDCAGLEAYILNMAAEVINEGLHRGIWTGDQLAAISTALPHPELLRQYAEGLQLGRAVTLEMDTTVPEFLNFMYSSSAWESIQQAAASEKGMQGALMKFLTSSQEVYSSAGPKGVADVSLADASAFDLLLIPGGIGTRTLVENQQFLTLLRASASKARGYVNPFL